MRTILNLLMDKAGDTPYDVQRKIGVPRTTTWRFISGGHNEPRSSTVQKWAKLYNVTESQLRGDIPIDGMVFTKDDPRELKDILPPEEYRHISNIKKMSSEARVIMYKLSAILTDKREKGIEIIDTENVPKNPLRAGKERYQSPARKSRIKDTSDHATKQTGTS